MALQVIGVGVGRTGTYSVKLALNQLGLGPCHHMEEVLLNPAVQVPLWAAAVERGHGDWAAIYDGYGSAVDWPTAAFYRELYEAFPEAKFVLTVRDPARWVASFSETIYKFMTGAEAVSEEMRDWFAMVGGVTRKSGFPQGLSRVELEDAFVAHADGVKAAIPGEQLLTYEVKEGWGPLCAFLDQAEPDGPFPRSNDRSEFWDKVAGAQK